MKKRLLYFVIVLVLVSCSGSYGASDIMNCFGKDIEQSKEECQE